MQKSNSTAQMLAVTIVAIALPLVLATNVAFAEDETIGSDEYRISCMSCHGVGGHGDGALAQFLNVKPTDLTSLAKNNGGQYPKLKAGQYPFLRVYQIIDDVVDRVIRVHSLLADHDYYLALPDQVIQRAHELLRAADVPEAQIRSCLLRHP